MKIKGFGTVKTNELGRVQCAANGCTGLIVVYREDWRHNAVELTDGTLGETDEVAGACVECSVRCATCDLDYPELQEALGL